MLARLRRFLVPPLFENEEKSRVSHLMTVFSWVAIAILSLIILFRLAFLRTGITIHTVTFSMVIVLLLLTQYLVNRGYVYGDSVFATLSTWGLMTYQAWYSDGLRDLSVTAYIVIIMFASLLLGWRFAIFMGLLSIASIWYFSMMEYLGVRPLTIDNPINYAFDLTSIFLLVDFLIYLLIAGWTRSLQNVEVEFPNPSGQKRDTLAFYELIQLEGEECVLAMFYDVTERKQAENALKDAEARTRALLTAVPDLIFEITKDGTLTGYIPSSKNVPAMQPEQFLGSNIRELFPPTIADQTLFALERALETDQLHAFEYGMPPGEEVQFFEARVSAVSPQLAIMMVRDISQRKWIEADREMLIKELEDKNAELERFTYTVSHDLKSPLITIKGFLGFLEKDASAGNIARLKADIKRIADATDKMQLLLNELLELSRIGRLINPYEQVSFEEIVHEAVELVQGRLLGNHIKVHIKKKMPLVYADRRRLVEVLQNLVDNSAKFVGNQPKPKIEIGHQGEEDGKPIFFVRDNGIGIEPQHQDRIFGLFNKLDADSEGTGIGLTLVKRIIEVHRGRIWVQSEAGKGSTFFFTLQTEL